MSLANANKRGAVTAVEVCKCFQLGKGSRALLREELSPQEFAALLLEHGQYADALKLVAHALPVREAIWWACRCARQTLAEDASDAEQEAVAVAEKWVAEGDDATRRAALAAGDAAGAATAAGGAALAVFYSGDSLALPDAAPVYPADYSAARLAAGSVLSAANTLDPSKTAENFRTFITQGIAMMQPSPGRTP
jgi:hypothetical protein